MTGFRHRFTSLALLSLTVLSGLLASFAISPAGAQSDPTCPLEPVSLPLFDATPATVIASTPAGSVDAPVPSEDELRAIVEGLVACASDTSQAVRYAVFTDRYLASLFTSSDPADQPAFERMMETGQLPERAATTLGGISGVEPLPDGRIELTMRVTTPQDSVEDRIVLAWDAGREAWLIDEIVSLDPPPTPPE